MLVRQLLVSSGEIEPSDATTTLSLCIKIHRIATPAHDKAIAALLADLSSEELRHPETGTKKIYTLASKYISDADRKITSVVGDFCSSLQSAVAAFFGNELKSVPLGPGSNQFGHPRTSSERGTA
ncbi:MAG TPA: hypothetical protein PLB25_01380 [Rhodoferax sp.]|nr:hypothetical protein [Rhodoferax sp.]